MKADEGAAPIPDVTMVDGAFRSVLDAMLDDVAIGSAVRDDRGAIVDFVVQYVDDRHVDGAGRTADEIVGRTWSELYPASADNGLLATFASVVDTGEPHVDDRVHYEDELDDGQVIEGWWSLSVARYGDGYVAATRNVTPLVVEERARHQQHLAAERARTAVECLQRAALPATIPVVAGTQIAARYQPAETEQPVGGDWYDIFEFTDGRVGLVIADVAGHGPEAAAFMVQVRNVVRAFAFEYVDPASVLDASNRMVSRLNEPTLFATCAYVVLEPSTRAVTTASAGHLPLLVLGDSARFLDAQVGPPLGVAADARYAASTTVLDPGDRLVLFTDGLLDERGQPLDQALDALLELPLAGSESAEATVDRLVATAVDGPDDVAVLCVRLSDQVTRT